jgi:hypothetical protein
MYANNHVANAMFRSILLSGLFGFALFALVGILILVRKFVLHKKTNAKASMINVAGFVCLLVMVPLMANVARNEYSKHYVGDGINPGVAFFSWLFFVFLVQSLHLFRLLGLLAVPLCRI